MTETQSIQNLLTQVSLISKKYEDLELDSLIKNIGEIQKNHPKSYSLSENSKWQFDKIQL